AERPRGVVLVIGDGMGVAHVTLAQRLRGEAFALGRMPHVGLVMTRSASSPVTDSAAAATALATGVRTANRHVGIDAHGKPHPTVLEVAEARGMATGMVTTASFADATPSAFAAHHQDRKASHELAAQVLRSGADLLIGSRADALGVEVPTLVDLARSGYRIPRTLDELRASLGPVLTAFRSGIHDGDSPDAPLPVLAAWAFDRLADERAGFFLLVEHEGIDTASHHNASAELEASLRSFDETVGVLHALVDRRGDVLMVVTGDHETGGLQITDAGVAWSTDGHTGEAVALFATGPGAEAFAGVHDLAAVGRALHAAVAP
ncbi:MAG TPA: alkaline phosphatase, partial [Kofleriaceae bacterium]|nr:alkaline phosphatase [Kofleriaceae bacterium]